jgi:hypothetical protein
MQWIYKFYKCTMIGVLIIGFEIGALDSGADWMTVFTFNVLYF